MADRTGLSGTQARTWTRTIRGPRLARLSPSCNTLHCSLRLPAHRAGRVFPLRHPSPTTRATSNTRRLQTTRIYQVTYSDTFRIRSRHCANKLQKHSSSALRTARDAAQPCASNAHEQLKSISYLINTVVIESGASTLGPAATRALPAVAEAAPVAGGIVSAAY